MRENKVNIKEGITLHYIKTSKFKNNMIAVFLTTPLNRKNVTWNSLLTAVLRRGTKKMPSQEKISENLERMYGASFDCGIEKTGDNQVLKFYIEVLNNEYLPQKEDLLKESIDILFQVAFDPFLENGAFKKEYVDGEKQTIKQLIDGKIDDKAKYAVERTTEIMYQNKPYGLYKFGYIEDLEKITPENLYKYYQELLSKCKIDIFISGEVKENEVLNILKQNEQLNNLSSRKPEFITNNIQKEELKKQEPKEISESMNISQGKLILGMNILSNDIEDRYTALVYNAILGGNANSKLFQNVREKASLAYTASSSYVRHKNIIFIKCGIEIENYKKALDIIEKQLKDIENGDFTEEQVEICKKQIISSIRGIPDSQDTEIIYYYGQEISMENISLEEYINKIQKITKEDVIKLANKININTIYFLKD